MGYIIGTQITIPTVFIFLALFVYFSSTLRFGHRLRARAVFSIVADHGRVLRDVRLPFELYSTANASGADYNQSQLLLKSNMVRSSITVQLPRGTDLSLSRKEEQILAKKEAAAKGNEGMTDLDFFKEEMRRMIDKIAS